MLNFIILETIVKNLPKIRQIPIY